MPKNGEVPKGFNPSEYAALVTLTGKDGQKHVLYETGANTPHSIASLSKAMTAYLVFEALKNNKIKLSDKIPYTPDVHNGLKETSIDIKPGGSATVGELLNAMLTVSSNIAPVMLARKLAGTENNFAKLANAKARELGMGNTQFHNASGFPKNTPGESTKFNMSTARDMETLFTRLHRDFSGEPFHGILHEKKLTAHKTNPAITLSPQAVHRLPESREGISPRSPLAGENTHGKTGLDRYGNKIASVTETPRGLLSIVILGAPAPAPWPRNALHERLRKAALAQGHAGEIKKPPAAPAGSPFSNAP